MSGFSPSERSHGSHHQRSGELTRRDALKRIGLASAAGAILPEIALPRSAKGNGFQEHPLGIPETYEWKKPTRPVTAAVMGAGNRGNVYASYAQRFPEELQIVGVAEPIPFRNERFAQTYGIPDKHRWVTWEHAFEVPKFADAIIITTPDHLHHGPAMAALDMGYDLILEKVIAQTWRECSDILRLAQRTGGIVAVCHVLRYSPYFRMLKHVVDSGRIGEVVSVQHLEPVEHIHMSHSFVRGPWRNSTESNPMILSKSCHDTDILRWIIGKPCERVSSFGSLRLFRPEMAPTGSAGRCTDGCAIERECPFSALKIYLERKSYLGHLYLPDHEDATILRALKEGRYGRCVYHCDNDVVDHQIMNMEFADGITAAFSMEGLTSYARRRTRITGTAGDVVGDEKEMTVFDFSTRETINWNIADHVTPASGHGGGDFGLVRDFVQAASRHDPSLLTSTIEASMESHLMGFMAEESRLRGGAVKEIRL